MSPSTIFDERNIPTTPTNYDCAWQNFKWLVFEEMHYNNVVNSVIVPLAYFNVTGSGMRMMIKGQYTETLWIIYQNGEGQINASANVAQQYEGIRIVGIR
jgi:hypothetical protein